jgi:hypothetical protein
LAVQVRKTLGLLIALILAGSSLAGLVQPATAQTGVEFTSLAAEVEFPTSIEFSMSARSGVDVERVQVFWRAAGSAATTMADASFQNDRSLEATYSADMTVRYLPPGLDVHYYFIVTTRSGETFQSPPETLFYIDTRFEWNSMQAGLVNVWWNQGSDEYAGEVAHSANRTLLLLKNEFGITTSEPVRIVMYGNDRDFSSALRPNSAEWIGGVAYSSLSLIIANVRPGTNAEREIDRMIPHEISHVVMHHASVNPYNSPPPWLDEGLATFVQAVDDPRLAPALDRAVRDGRLIPIGALRSSFPLDPDQALLSYAESLSIVTYLVEAYGQDAVGELATVYQQEVTHDEAVERVLGKTVEDLDADWKAWLGYAGDRPEAQLAAGLSTVPERSWFAIILGATLALTVGFVAFLFWRTRKYAESDEEILPPDHA